MHGASLGCERRSMWQPSVCASMLELLCSSLLTPRALSFLVFLLDCKKLKAVDENND